MAAIERGQNLAISLGRDPDHAQQDHVHGLCCPVASQIRYVSKSDEPYERLKEHTA